MIVDSHQHFWDPGKVDYSWLKPDAGAIWDVFDEEVLAPELAGAEPIRTVLVQSANNRADTADMLERANRTNWIAGVVGWLPLDRPDEAERLLAADLTEPKFKGVRHLIHHEPDPDWLVRPAVIEGLRVLARHGVPFDVVAIWPLHLPHVARLLDAVPDLKVVIDHLGKPDASREVDPAWRADLAAVAALPGVHAKFSGLNTPYTHASDWRWTPSDLVPFLDTALELFGPDRVMWGGDWPISVYNGGYRAWLDGSLAAAAHLDFETRDRVFRRTATAFYRLDPAQ